MRVAEKSSALLFPGLTSGAIQFHSTHRLEKQKCFSAFDSFDLGISNPALSTNRRHTGALAPVIFDEKPHSGHIFAQVIGLSGRRKNSLIFAIYHHVTSIFASYLLTGFGHFYGVVSILTIDLRRILCNGIHTGNKCRTACAVGETKNTRMNEHKFNTGGFN